jgi:hypothetical protein
MYADLDPQIIFSHTSYTGTNSDFVGPEAHSIVGALFKKNNTKLRIKK